MLPINSNQTEELASLFEERTASAAHPAAAAQGEGTKSKSTNNDDIPPGYGGLVTDINPNDVLKGRGGKINNHVGNVQFRELIARYRPMYFSETTTKGQKMQIANEIVQTVRNMNPPGRFLIESKDGGRGGGWVEIGDKDARRKTSQSIREGRVVAVTTPTMTTEEHQKETTKRLSPFLLPKLPGQYKKDDEISSSTSEQARINTGTSTSNLADNKRDLDSLLHQALQMEEADLPSNEFHSQEKKQKRFHSIRAERTMHSLPDFKKDDDDDTKNHHQMWSIDDLNEFDKFLNEKMCS